MCVYFGGLSARPPLAGLGWADSRQPAFGVGLFSLVPYVAGEGDRPPSSISFSSPATRFLCFQRAFHLISPTVLFPIEC